MKYGTRMCVICRVNFPTWGSVMVDGLRAGYCRPCIVGIAKLRWQDHNLDATTEWVREVIASDRIEQEPDVLQVREAMQKIYAKRTEP